MRGNQTSDQMINNFRYFNAVSRSALVVLVASQKESFLIFAKKIISKIRNIDIATNNFMLDSRILTNSSDNFMNQSRLGISCFCTKTEGSVLPELKDPIIWLRP